MSQIEANILYIGELDFQSLDIPFYQRPYRWKTLHVEVLLQSLLDNLCKEEYRIGSIILHAQADNRKHEIVDGQQRLTTLSLLMMCLEGNDTSHKLTCTYDDVESQRNVALNYTFISKWLDMHKDINKTMLDFIKYRCSVVVIVAGDLSEAFQMFDSQNGRGKELEAYNLLKAYHLRAIENERSAISVNEEKREIDRSWEESVRMKTKGSDDNLLKYILCSLFRIRNWSRQKEAWGFNKTKIKEFKGLQFADNAPCLPLSNASMLLYLYYKSEANVSVRSKEGRGKQNPFVGITMDIINGKLFFEYIRTYVDSYNYLLMEPKKEENPLYEFQKDFKRWCCDYPGASRKGDGYVREVYVALVIALYDRFGEDFVVRYYRTLYILAYRERLVSKRIFESTAGKYARKYFDCIASAISEMDLNILSEWACEVIEQKMEHTGGIEKYIKKNGGVIQKEK